MSPYIRVRRITSAGAFTPGTDWSTQFDTDSTVTLSAVPTANGEIIVCEGTLDATLAALAAFNTSGLLAQTAADVFAGRTITAGSARVVVGNGDGVAGNPTIDVSSGSLFDHFADAGSVGTSETDLYSDAVAAGRLTSNGDKLVAIYGVTLVNSTSTKQIRVYFAGSLIFDTGALSISASSEIAISVLIIRESSTKVRYTVSATTTGASTGSYANVGKLTGLTLSGTNILKITGQAGGIGPADNDIVAANGSVGFMGAA